jgi:hypothetical protein
MVGVQLLRGVAVALLAAVALHGGDGDRGDRGRDHGGEGRGDGDVVALVCARMASVE